MSPTPFITIVSGLPRSGTSVMMQMLQAGGLPHLADDIRAPDIDNPKGYLEFERVKNIKKDQAWLPEARGKVVKMVHLLLLDLPPGEEYRVIFMRRNLDEVLASQKKMLARLGRAGGSLSDDALKTVFSQQVDRVHLWLKAQPHVRLIDVEYAALIATPRAEALRVNAFLGGALDETTMSAAVDPSLYRNRA